MKGKIRCFKPSASDGMSATNRQVKARPSPESSGVSGHREDSVTQPDKHAYTFKHSLSLSLSVSLSHTHTQMSLVVSCSVRT